MTAPAERRRLALAVLTGRPVAEVAAEAGIEPELVARWVEQFDEGGLRRLAGRGDPESFEARDRFLVLVAHEFRTPLTVIRGWAELLGQELPEDVRTSAVERVLRQVDSLERVARNAIDAAAVARGGLHLVVAPLAVRTLIDAVAGGDVRLEPGDEVEVVADSDRLEQVVGDIVAHATRLSADAAPSVELHDADDHLTVTVTARGRQLTYEEAADLFEPYGRSDTTVGTGLGLFLCRALVAAHGGEMGLRSDGVTSAFWFRLPKAGPAGGPLVERRSL